MTQRANAPNDTFPTLHFATVREREGPDCLVENTIYFNITIMDVTSSTSKKHRCSFVIYHDLPIEPIESWE